MKIIAASVIGIMIVAGFAVFSYGAFARAIFEKRLHIVDLQKEIKNFEKSEDYIEELETLLAQVEEQKDEIESVFVHERSLIRVIETFEETARVLGVTLAVENASLPVSSDAGPVFQLRVEGDFDSIYRFIRTLEILPFQFSFNDVDMRKESNPTAKKSVWVAIIQLSLLSYIPQ